MNTSDCRVRGQGRDRVRPGSQREPFHHSSVENCLCCARINDRRQASLIRNGTPHHNQVIAVKLERHIFDRGPAVRGICQQYENKEDCPSHVSSSDLQIRGETYLAAAELVLKDSSILGADFPPLHPSSFLQTFLG